MKQETIISIAYPQQLKCWTGDMSSLNVENLTVKTVKVTLSKSQGMPSKSEGIWKDFS